MKESVENNPNTAEANGEAEKPTEGGRLSDEELQAVTGGIFATGKQSKSRSRGRCGT